MTDLVSLLFITMIPIDCKKLQIFPYTCLLINNNYNIGEFTSATSKERMTMNKFFFAGATPTN